MKNKLLFLFAPLLLILSSQVAKAQWATSGTNIYNTNTGNVGIGTTAPSSQLTLAGQTGRVANFGSDATTGSQVFGAFGQGRAFFGYNGTTQNAVIQGNDSKGIEFNVNNATFGAGQAMVINTSGNVGIGTSTPATALDVNGTLTLEGNGYAGLSIIPGIQISTFPRTLRFNNTTSAATEGFQFFNSNQNTSLMMIQQSGNVGIGTASPGYLFDIQRAGSGNTGAIAAIEGFAANGAGGAYLKLNKSRGTTLGSLVTTANGDALGVVDFSGVNGSNAVATGSRIISYQDGTSTTSYVPGRLAFFTSDGTASPAERLTVSGSGNVGIGTVTPSYPLSVEGAAGRMASFGANLASEDDAYATYATRASFGYNGASLNAVVQGLAGKGIEFNVNSGTFGDGTKMLITSAGKVGIGTINPDEALTVAGNVHTKEVLVDLDIPTPDYVFNTDYQLPSLSDVRAYINTNHHLQDMPSAAEVDKNGLKLGQMNMALLKKVEELTLYLLEKDQKEKAQQTEIDELKLQVKSLLNKQSSN